MSDEEAQPTINAQNKLLMEAITAQMEQMMETKMNALREELQHSEDGRNPRRQRREHEREPRRNREQSRDQETNTYYSSGTSHGSPIRHRRAREGRNQPRDDFGGLKLRIPPFHGKNDPDAYLEWEKKIELVFNCQHYTETNKVKVAATEFYDYALSWWDQIVTTRRRNDEYPVETWTEMKNLMRRRFVPSHYHRELHQKLRGLTQGNRSVEEYYQEMETLMLRANVSEDREATMSRFLGGLRRDIQDRLETQHYVELEEMLHKAILFEQQIKRKSVTKPSFGSSSRLGYEREERSSYQRDFKSSTNPKQEAPAMASNQDNKGKGKEAVTKSKDVRCFKCQGRGHYANECSNKRIMMLLDNGDIETANEYSSSEEHEEKPTRGELLVTMRSLSILTKAEEQEQRENLFHTRCLVQGKVCSLIVDGGSCTNVASETMVQKLGLERFQHPKPYKLHWLNESGEMVVKNQVRVFLAIGGYEDEVVCDVLPMEASHILLGRPWQSDRRVIHDGYTNRYSFEFKGRKTVLIRMTPQEVYQDQMSLKTKEDSKAEKSCILIKAGKIKNSFALKQPKLLFVFKETIP